MKILILGGTSFFGKETAGLLAKAGHSVSVFSRRCPIDGLPLDVIQHRGDRTVEVDLVRMSTQYWDAIIDNICFTADDAEKAIRVFSGRTGLYVFTGSSAVYSLFQGATAPFREIQTDILPLKIDLKDTPYYTYARGKYEAEKKFLQAFKEKSFPVVITRPPVVIGPGDPTLRAYSYWLRIADGGPLILPNPTVSSRYIFSGDMARACEALISAPDVCGKTYNLGDSSTISLEDLIKLSARIMNKEVKLCCPPHSWLKERCFNFEASPLSGASDFITDITRSEKDLHWTSSPMNDWLSKTINWFFFKYSGPMPKNYASRKAELDLAERWERASRTGAK